MSRVDATGTAAVLETGGIGSSGVDARTGETCSDCALEEQGQAEALALSSPLLLPYERVLVEEALEDDCLIVTAAGLGWQRVAAVLLRIAQHARIAEAEAAARNPSRPAHPATLPPTASPPVPQHAFHPPAAAAAAAAAPSGPSGPTPTTPTPTPTAGPSPSATGIAPAPNGRCVLVLGASPWQRALISSELARHDPDLPPPVDITNEVPALERIQLYRAHPGGRPLFITPRILVVDLLARRVTSRDVAGVLLLNAHRASDTSGEGFAVALLRADIATRGSAAGGSCWIRAVSDAPTAFNQGFNKVEKVMKALHLRRLHLWPRFQEHVRQCLDEHKPVVVEWDQELSGPMVLIQAALLEVLEGLIRELRRTNKNLDTSELVLENGVLRSFDEIVRRQLDPIWHTVSWKTRRICSDLRTIRELSALLLSSDCVTFLAHLEGLRQSEGVRCVWLFHDATHAVFEQARRRVYIYRQPGSAGATAGGSSSSSSGPAEVEAVLEEPPKWGLLVELLAEVQRQRRQLRALALRAGSQGGSSTHGSADCEGAGGAAVTAAEGSAAAAGEAVGPRPAGRPVQAEAVTGADGAVEVVDLASSGDEEEAEEVEDQVGGHERGQAADRAAAGDAAAGPASGADAAATLRKLLEDLGLSGGTTDGGGGGVDPETLTARDLRLLAEAGRGPVLVVARELHAAKLLERVAREGSRTAMQHLYESYLLSKLQAPGVAGGGGGGAADGGGGRGGGRGGRGGRGGWNRYRSGPSNPDETGRGPLLRPGEHQALLAEAQRVGVERGTVPATRGRAAKRAKISHDQPGPAGASAAGDAAAAAIGRGRGRGRGRGGADAAAPSRGRQRKPDDSPVRVAAAEAAAADAVKNSGDQGDWGERRRQEPTAAPAGNFVGVKRKGAPSSPAGSVRARAEDNYGGCGVMVNDEEEDDDWLVAPAAGGGRTGGARAGGGAAGGQAQREARRGGGRGAAGRGRSGGGIDGGRGTTAGSRQRPLKQQQQQQEGQQEEGQQVGQKGQASRAGQAQQGGASRPARSYGAYGPATGTGDSADEGEEGPGHAAGAAGAGGASAGAAGQAAGGPGEPLLLRDVQFVSLDSHDEFVLWRLRPSFIIMYEPDLAFLRQVEVYQAERCLAGGCPLWLHTLSYGSSVEQQRFKAAVERERDTLLRLIQAKQHLALPAGAAGVRGAAGGPNRALTNGSAAGTTGGGGALSADLWLDVYSANALTRAAGGRAAGRGGGAGGAAPRRLVVDVREFMSGLPAVLHQKGFELLPVTLEVGDYVLSPQLVVERKSLPDLHASLASGRLYHQAESMCRHYARPLLLIEFDPDRQFGLQSASELGDDIDPKNVISKLTLLTLHFPKLRLLWSRSPHATADIFASLKSNQEEPEPAAAALVGVPLGPDGVPLPLGAQPGAAGGAGGGGAALLESVVNQPALELLRRLPGVNDSNYRALLGHVSSLAELAALPLERLEAIMASAKNARALREFLDAPCPRM